MRKILCLILTLMMAAPLAARAEGASISVGSASAKEGESFTLPVTLSGNTGFSNIGIEISYDSSAMRLEKAAGESSVGAIFTPAQTTDLIPYNMNWDSTGNITYNGTMAELEFTALKSGTYPVSVSFYKGRDGDYIDGTDLNYDESFAPLGLTYVNGSVTISGSGAAPTAAPTAPPAEPSGAYVSLGTVTGKAGETVEVPLELANNSGFSNLGVEVSYDKNVLTLVSADANTNVGAVFTPAQTTDTIPFNMNWDSTSNNSYNGELAVLKFTIADNAPEGSYDIGLSFYRGRNGDYADGIDVNYDENFSPLNLSYIPGSIIVSNKAETGKSISVENVQNDGTLAFKASFRSDENITGVAVAAVYDNSGTLIYAKHYDAAEEIDFSFGSVRNAAAVKVFWWDSVENMTPQAHSKTVSL